MTQYLPQAEILEELKTSFAIVADHIQLLNRYANFNYKVSCIGAGDVCGTSYSVKLFTAWDEIDNFKLQQCMMSHLSGRGLNVPKPMQTVDGEYAQKCKIGGKDLVMQVMTFIDGETMNSVTLTSGEISDLCFDLGRMLGKIQVELKTFSYIEERTHDSSYPWLFENALLVEDKLHFVADISVRKLAKKYLDLFRDNLLPLTSKLRRGFIHGDFNDTNIILSSEKNMKNKVVGVIDFGDCSEGFVIADLGICLAYTMIRSLSASTSDPIRDAGRVIDGFETGYPMTSVEKEVLFEASASRLVVSLVMAHYNLQEELGNWDSIFIHAKYIPEVLKLINRVGKQEVLNIWFGKKIDNE